MIILVVAVVVIVLWWISASNDMKRRIVKIDEALSGVDVALTKRYDVLTKLLDITKGYAKHEKETIVETIKLRRGMTPAEYSEENRKMDAAMREINIVAENYPELRSSENFKQLQLAVLDVEEHLQAARRAYNGNVSSFNQAIVTFPNFIVAKSMKLEAKDFFTAEETKKEDVKMEF